MRTCVVCQTRRDDTGMVRAGRNADGSWYLGRGTGRGIWWCRGLACGPELRARHVARALRAGVSELDVEPLRGRAVGGGLE